MSIDEEWSQSVSARASLFIKDSESKHCETENFRTERDRMLLILYSAIWGDTEMRVQLVQHSNIDGFERAYRLMWLMNFCTTFSIFAIKLIGQDKN